MKRVSASTAVAMKEFPAA
jgi:hypothetical protein